MDTTKVLVVANAPDPDGLVIFPVHGDGTLGEASFAHAGGAGPFYIAFLNRSRDTFLNGFAERKRLSGFWRWRPRLKRSSWMTGSFY